MRAARVSIAAIILTSFFLLALRESRYATPAFGQAAAPAPPVITLPAAPGQPQAFATIGAIPQLAPAPGPALASPTLTPAGGLVFRCACSGPGFPTSWVGPVSNAPNLLLAEQQYAPGICTSYLTGANAGSPYLGSTGSSASFPGTLYSFPPGQVGNSSRVQTFNASAQRRVPLSAQRDLVIVTECENCSCD